MIERIDLNGYWDWKLPGGMWQRKWVPSSYFCVGLATFQKEVTLNLPPGKRAFLCFDGVAYKGRAWFNGAALGEMLPYIPYRFDMSEHVTSGANRIQVEIEDITADFGPTGGWEDYGGITRDVYIELSDPVWIDNVQWLCNFDEGYTLAGCQVNVTLAGQAPTPEWRVSAALALNRQTVYQGEEMVRADATPAQAAFAFDVANPLLWSPDSPVLYDLVVTVEAGALHDVRTLRVGFRELKAVGSRFYLNGQEIFLKGVARHEMWGDDQGFTLTREQIDQDLRLIKQLGANYVRLVHYPHTRYTIERCDSLGLMVTEEPGLWWSDLTDAATTSKALQVMERTILRDRNSPSVIAWLLFNECPFPGMPEYLERGKALCNRLDPSRMVSAANCLDAAQAKRVFDQAGMDYYTFHPYGYEPNLMIQGLEALRGKPCVFTEWGGWLIMGNLNLMRWFKHVIAEYAHNRDPLPNLAGMAWWQWQDVFQFSRGLPGCTDGTLSDGLVDKDRNTKPMYSVMADYFAAVDGPGIEDYLVEALGQVIAGDETHAMRVLDLTPHQEDAAQKAAWTQVLGSLKVFQSLGQEAVRKTRGPAFREPVENVGGLRTRLAGRPLILAHDCKHIRIACGFTARKLYFLGQTTFFDGYPLRGRLGDVIARYTVHYHDGSSGVVDLRQGYELASASMIGRTSRINPVAVNTRRVLILHLEEDWEVYQVGCLEVDVDSSKAIDVIDVDSLDDAYYPLLYGISASI